ncbi:MAG: galactokinase family protein, partial [Gemmatimonadota bacterium]
AARYGAALETVRVVRSPYRICPLGAHIDHQLGTVTAMAIDRAVHLAYAPVDEPRVRLRSRDFAGEVDFPLDPVPPKREGDWGNFPRGAVRALQDAGHALRRGLVGVTAGRLGEGGLSSSAAIGVAYLLALEEANGIPLPADDNIALDQAIENGYLGLRNGILDQSAILLSRRDQLTVIDCKARQHELAPAGSGMPPFAILIPFSGLTQALVSTDYNRRVEECRVAATVLLAAAGRPGAEPRLGNLSAAEYEACRGSLTGAPGRRAAHFFTEMDRVGRGIRAWKAGDLSEVGRLMTASGDSSIRQYECGSPPLVDLYEILVSVAGVYGGRFSGAGFRGCCVALVDAAAAARAADEVKARYAARHPDLASRAPVLVCRSADGARIL